MPERDFKINIVGDASSLRAAAAAAGDSLGEVGNQSAKTGNKMEEAGKKFEKTGHHMNQARLRGELFRRVMMSIGAYTPGLEYAVYGGATAFGALTAGAIGAGIALEKLIEYFQSFEDELQSVNRGELKDHTAALGRIQDSWKNAKQSLADYYVEMRNAGSDNDPIKTEIQRVNELRDARIAASEAIIKAYGKEEIARLKASGATPEQIAAAQGRIDLTVARMEAGKREGDTVGSLKNEQQNRQAAAEALDRQAQDALENARKSALAKQQHDEELAALEKKNSGEDKQKRDLTIEEAKRRLEHLQSLPMVGQIPAAIGDFGTQPSEYATPGQIAKAKEEFERLASARDREQKRIEQLRGSQFDVDAAAAEAASRAASAKGASITNERRLNQLPGEIGQASKVLDATNTDATRIAGLAEKAGITLQQLANINQRLQSGLINSAQIIAGLEQRISAIEESQRRLNGRQRSQLNP